MDDPGKNGYDGAENGDGQFDDVRSSAAPTLIEYRPLSDFDETPSAPTSGMQQLWWLADSVPFGRVIVIGAAALALLGTGFLLGRAGQKVIYQQITVPARAEAAEKLASALPPVRRAVTLEADIVNPMAQLPPPNFVRFQPRLPWEEYPDFLDPRYELVSQFNQQISTRNYNNMAEYVQRLSSGHVRYRRPPPETYYVTHRTPAYAKLGNLGDTPSTYLMPGTPLQLDHTQSRWALVIAPSGESMWISTAVMTLDKTHRST